MHGTVSRRLADGISPRPPFAWPSPKNVLFITAANIIRGHTINIDGTALSHDLVFTGLQVRTELSGVTDIMSRASVHQLTVIPVKAVSGISGYGFEAAYGNPADLQYGVGQDGSIQLDPSFARSASASGNTLIIRVNGDPE